MRALGVDGGGSAMKAVVLGESGAITELPAGPPVNGIMDHDLAERVSALIRQTRAEAVGLGLAGLRSDRDAALLADAVEAGTGVRPAVADDATAALWGAFGSAPGAIVIAGTGSAALARDRAGTLVRLGGHGFVVGDEGSGYWIGRELVRLALRSMTGADEPRPALERLVRRELGATPHDIENTIYRDATDRARLASLAPLASEIDDPAVDRTLRAAAGELIDLARSASRLAGGVPIALIGGLWGSRVIREAFLSAVPAEPPAESPSVGAARWALSAAAATPAFADREVTRPGAPSGP